MFLKACPFNVLGKRKESIIQKHLIDDSQVLKTMLQGTKKQMDINFDLLTEENLAKVVEFGCKILHLSP